MQGRMVEIYGKEACGKTTLALHIVKEAQKLGGFLLFLLFIYLTWNHRAADAGNLLWYATLWQYCVLEFGIGV